MEPNTLSTFTVPAFSGEAELEDLGDGVLLFQAVGFMARRQGREQGCREQPQQYLFHFTSFAHRAFREVIPGRAAKVTAGEGKNRFCAMRG